VLWALGQPASAAGLLIAFLLGLWLRAFAQRVVARRVDLLPRYTPLLPNPRHDIDPFGAVAAVLGGTGWGKQWGADQPYGSTSYRSGKGRLVAVLLAGPVTTLVASQILLAIYRGIFADGAVALTINYPSDVLRGALAPSAAEQFVLSIAVGLFCFGVLALIPVPPLDGFGLLWLSLRRPSQQAQKMRHWLADNNLGVVLLLVFLVLPLGFRAPLVLLIFDLVGTPVLRAWA
jgi:Zn-dependent protease